MSSEIDTFLYEGMSRYKKANEVYHTFRRELQSKLQLILKTREDWGDIEPDIETIKSTTYWPEYPLINARITCDWKGKSIVIVIAVNLYDVEDDFPVLCLWIEKGKKYWPSQEVFVWSNEFTYEKHQLRFQPNSDSFILEDDFEKLFNEFVSYVTLYSSDNSSSEYDEIVE